MGFNCTGCGSCCKRVQSAVENTKHIPEFSFPYTWDETGRCEMLDADNRCKVYENRPLMCNIEKVIEHFQLDQEAFYQANYEACHRLQEEDGLDESFHN